MKCRVLRSARNHNRRRNPLRSNNVVAGASADVITGMSEADARAGLGRLSAWLLLFMAEAEIGLDNARIGSQFGTWPG